MRDDLHLIDTSIWLEVLARGRADPNLIQRADELLAADVVAITGMVRLELLGGARTRKEYQRLDRLLSALHYIPVDEDCWDEAAHAGFGIRQQGISVPFTDLLIAAVAIRHKATLLHRDRHFDLIAAHLPLKVESHVPART
jgi:predicted nucleic acid-binding protein